MTFVASFVIGLSSRTSSTSTDPVIVSPGRTGALKFQFVFKNTEPDDSGRDEVYVTPYPGPGAKLPISTDGGNQPVWSRRDSELFYRAHDGRPSRERAPSRLVPEVLFELRAARIDPNAPDYDVAPDGRFLMGVQSEPETQEFRVVLNWFDELKRLVPVD